LLWVHGAFEPAGEPTLVYSDRRDGASHIRLLEQMITAFPAERWLMIEDNLSTHHSRDMKTALLAWPEIQIQFIPRYASWLNLIEPWWKQLKSLALKGWRFADADELQSAFEEETGCGTGGRTDGGRSRKPCQAPCSAATDPA
jgi:hypothetical protein